MKPQPKTYNLRYWMEGFGYLSESIHAVDAVDAAQQLLAPLRKKYGDSKPILVTEISPA